MTTFNDAFNKVVLEERGYALAPFSPDASAKYGISQQAYPELDIQRLTLYDAKAIYRVDYWDAACSEQLPDDLRLLHFDMAISMGVEKARQWLRRLSMHDVIDGVSSNQTPFYVHKTAPSERSSRQPFLYVV